MIGFINVYKPSGITSNAVLSKIKKQFNVKKIGHMGTLDPMAEGILPIALGSATKLFDYFLNKKKTYIATFEFGYETDTLDATGNIQYKTDNIPTKENVILEIKKFLGVQNQMPPKYSAKNINGKRAYDLARNNVEFELKPKEIEIFEYKLISNDSVSYTFEITCSSGTYIRSLCRDLGRNLNSFATMTKLIRSESGKFNLNNSTNLNDILNSSLDNFIIDVTDLFDYPIINVSENQGEKLKNGMTILVNNKNGYYFVISNESNLGLAVIDNNKLKLKVHFN